MKNQKISVSEHQKSRKGTNPIRPNDAIPSFFPSEGAPLSIQPYILTFYQSKHAKITTQASYQNLGGYMASYADYDTRDGCTHWEITVHLAPNVVLAQANDSEYAMSYPLSLHTMNWFSSIWMDRIVLATTTRRCLHERALKRHNSGSARAMPNNASCTILAVSQFCLSDL